MVRLDEHFLSIGLKQHVILKDKGRKIKITVAAGTRHNQKMQLHVVLKASVTINWTATPLLMMPLQSYLRGICTSRQTKKASDEMSENI